MLEYLSGGEMLRQLQAMKRYSEANACQMFKQVRQLQLQGACMLHTSFLLQQAGAAHAAHSGSHLST